MTAADAPRPGALRRVWADLGPGPGRLALTWRVALACAIVTVIAMMLKIPEAAISCYLIIFLMKEDAVQNCVTGLGLIALATVIVAIMIPIINFSVDSPPLRLAVMFLASFIFLFLSSTTPLGEQAAIVGLIIAFLMTLVTDVPVGQIADQGLLMAWKMAAMPMAVMILFSLALGTPSQTLVRRRIVERLRAVADCAETGIVDDRIDNLLSEGNAIHLSRMALVGRLHLMPSKDLLWLNGAIETSYRLLLAQVAAVPRPSAATAEAIRAMADVIERGSDPPTLPKPGTLEPSPLAEALAGLTATDGGGRPQPDREPPFAADAFSNPSHARFALKTSLAALICYLIYTGLHWNGVHTAMITCYVAALGTLGETIHKLVLRIVGCLIGAALGALTLIFVMPHLTSIGGLMVVVFVGVLIGAWVAAGRESIAYAGVQIALAFLLTTVYGFGPSYEFSQASNRIAGILLGIAVIYVMFTQIWPRSVSDDIREQLAKTRSTLLTLDTLDPIDLTARTAAVARAMSGLGRARELLDLAGLESSRGTKSGTGDALAQCFTDMRRLCVPVYAGDKAAVADLKALDIPGFGLAETFPLPGLASA